MTLWLLLAALIIAVAGVVLALRLGARDATRRAPDEDVSTPPLAHYRGGMRWPLPGRLGTATTPASLVAFDLYEWGVRFEASRAALRRLSPTWSADYHEIATAELVRRPGMRGRNSVAGLRLRADVAGAPVVFLSPLALKVADDLEQRGVRVVRTPATLKAWSNR